ncbi:MAG: NYN domain-containing protein [Actinomycetia bacterium]|nr:NYN domain-containing protein [Actinomycetes bacterium]
MPEEPVVKRTIVFFDGQNLFHTGKEIFQIPYPNYDVAALAQLLCTREGWQLTQTRFYTGVPEAGRDPFWHGFWSRKTAQMTRSGVVCFTRQLHYVTSTTQLANGTTQVVEVGQEKGVDVRIALDVIRLARQNAYDVAIIVSRDQDFSEVADEIRALGKEQNRWIKIASAFCCDGNPPRRGINKTDWLRISQTEYNSCVDSRDYRPPASQARLPFS